MAGTLPSPSSSSREDNLAVGKCPRDRQHLLQSPVFTKDGLRVRAGMGWAGDSSVRLHSRVSGGGCAQQGSQEVKIALPADPQRRVPGRALGFGPGAILGPGRVTFPGGRPPPSPPPPSFPPKAAGHCGSLASRQRKEGRAEAGGGRRRGGRPGGGVLRAGPPMMPKVPDLPLGGPQAQHWGQKGQLRRSLRGWPCA